VVNKAWRQFARENGASEQEADSVGINYLSVCCRGVGQPLGEESQEAAQGIREVLAGKRKAFSLEYPCDSPTEKRWFRMSVTPLSASDGKAVVSHDNITDRKLAEDKVRSLLAEKELLLKEVHHRIKNHMNNLVGFFMLQELSMTDPTAVTALRDAQSRVHSMMQLYDKLYQSENFNSLSLKLYISPLAILLNEILTNTMKYAFADTEMPQITVSGQIENYRGTLIVDDNGAGFDVPEDISAANGFGLKLVNLLVKQINGSLTIERNRGTRCVVTFPISADGGLQK
jgi:two-component sensor histidine kinase